MIESVWKFINNIAISHKRGMEQEEIMDVSVGRSLGLLHHTTLEILIYHASLVFHQDGSVGQSFHVWKLYGDEQTLQLIIKAIEKAVLPLLFSVHLLRGIPRQLDELVEISDHSHASLLEVAELIFLPP